MANHPNQPFNESLAAGVLEGLGMAQPTGQPGRVDTRQPQQQPQAQPVPPLQPESQPFAHQPPQQPVPPLTEAPVQPEPPAQAAPPLPPGVGSVDDLISPKDDGGAANEKIMASLKTLSDKVEEFGRKSEAAPPFKVDVGEDIDDGVKSGFEQLAAQINKLSEAVRTPAEVKQPDLNVDAEMQKLRHTQFDVNVSLIPGWNELKGDPNFLTFLMSQDPTGTAGRSYADVMREARESGDAKRAEGIVGLYRASNPAPRQAPQVPQSGTRTGASVEQAAAQAPAPAQFTLGQMDSWAENLSRRAAQGAQLNPDQIWEGVRQFTDALANGNVDMTR